MTITLDEIRRAIAASGANWEAGDTEFLQRLGGASFTIPTQLLGLNIEAEVEEELLKVASVVSFPKATPPAAVDWRNQAGILTPVKDQGFCGSCLAFALCATMESSYLIDLGAPQSIDLSEAHLFFCAGGDCKNGLTFSAALGFAQKTGVGAEKDFPYAGADLACKPITPALQIRRSQTCISMADRKRCVEIRPALASMAVYEDLGAYAGGIYSNVRGALRGRHAVVVVGYDDGQSCWIVRNSWGTGFGMNGYFKIAYGQCGIDTNPFYDIEVIAVGATS